MFNRCLGILLMLPTWSVAAPVPVADPTSDEIREAIQNLDHPQYRVRTLAAKKLLAAGTKAIEPLTKAATNGNIEASDRAVKILQDLAFNSNEATMAAGRNALHQLANSKGQAREPAREILKRFRGQIMDKMQTSGARFQFDGEKVRAIYFDSVPELAALLPLLREFPEVEELSFSTKKFGDAEMKQLLPLKKLKWLNLFESNIGDESLKLLKNFPNLESIPMGRTRITDDGLKHLADLTQLEYVGLRGNNITDAGLVHLKKLVNLTGLTLQETKVTDAGMERLQPLAKLSYLRIQSTTITDAGLEKLKGMKSLQQIDAAETKVTRDGADKVKETIPGLIVTMRTYE